MILTYSFSFSFPPLLILLPLSRSMEDCNALVSDCIIISCCCECLFLQFLIFVFLQLPRKVARKTKEYAKRKLRSRRKKQQGEEIVGKHIVDDEFVGLDSGKSMSMKILELEGMAVKDLHKWGSCTDEVDKVLGDLSLKGEFAFGSFWGKDYEHGTTKSYCKCSRSLTKEDELEFGSHVVKFHLIEVIGPLSSS